uniref:Uncharacterized protein n=1 Tax=viral metagenome TaxID=1070528 RepID=A0A6C0ACR1_9ZZZZ
MTSIGDLQQMHGNMMDPRYEEMLQQAYLQQQQQPQQYQQDYQDNQYSQEELDNILRDINQEEKPKKKKKTKKSNSTKYDSNDTNKDKIIDLLKDIGLIVIVYVLLSMTPIKKIFSNYIPQLNKGPNGKVPITGLLIYGTLLGVIVTIVKKYLLKK